MKLSTLLEATDRSAALALQQAFTDHSEFELQLKKHGDNLTGLLYDSDGDQIDDSGGFIFVNDGEGLVNCDGSMLMGYLDDINSGRFDPTGYADANMYSVDGRNLRAWAEHFVLDWAAF